MCAAGSVSADRAAEQTPKDVNLLGAVSLFSAAGHSPPEERGDGSRDASVISAPPSIIDEQHRPFLRHRRLLGSGTSHGAASSINQ